MAPGRAFKLGKAFAWVGLLSIPLIFVGFILATVLPAGGELVNLVGAITVAVSTLSLVVATMGTASTIMLGWRADRRQAAEFKLKIEQLQLQLAEERARAVESVAPSN